jgi:AraC-like DNA-binding protein
MVNFYEQHEHPDPQFPIIFHLDTHCDAVHWHESIELLYFVEGNSMVLSNMIHYPVSAGDIAVINCDNIHKVFLEHATCRYYCLIVDKSFCDELNIAVEALQFNPVIRDNTANEWMKRIVIEMENTADFYQQAVKAAVIGLLVHLCRYQLSSNTFMVNGRDGCQTAMVKASIGIIRQRYKQPLSVDDICDRIGFSKYYFCRIFKEYTGKTVVDYINFLRCSNARSLIRSGAHNVSESAFLSGVPNLSYFSKLYKRHMGVSPSEDSQLII